MKSLPEMIEKSDSFQTDENKPKQNLSSSLNSIPLPNFCIFCDKDVRYKKRKSEHLLKCEIK